VKRRIGPKIRWASCFLVAGEAAAFSAVAGEDVAGRVRGVVGGEEDEECGNFFGLGVAAERDLAIDLVEHGVGVFESLGMTRADLMKFFQHLTDATESAFPLLIMNGVTGVRDMGRSGSNRSLALRDCQRFASGASHYPRWPLCLWP